MKKPYLVDVPVALIFFNRPDVFSRVFECVRNARPSKLFLIQDGPRAGRTDDIENMKKCRQVCSEIDWECEVHQDFSEDNLGCGMRIYSGLTNAFKVVDRLVIIEDDIVIAPDFLPFCSELLEKYKDDQRVGMISGMNHLGRYDECPYSYFYSSHGGSIWGWATWKRVWDDIEWDLTKIVKDEYITSIFPYVRKNKKIGDRDINRLRQKSESMSKGEKQSSWSFQFGFTTLALQNRLRIIPKVNLTSNIGIIGESTHTKDSISKLPRGIRCVYNAPTYEINKPLIHPKYMVDDIPFLERQYRIMGTYSPGIKIYRFFESKIYQLFPKLGEDK